MRLFMRFSYVIMSLILVMMTSCRGRLDKEREVLSSLLGREIIIPDSLECRIQDIPVDYDMNDADYKIITYIDSAGCVPCRMKLSAWTSTLTNLMAHTCVEIAYLMIIDSDDINNVNENLRQDGFLYPIAVDKNKTFIKINGLPNEDMYHTLLLDSNNHVIAVGNPAVNPKVKDVYRQNIKGDNSSTSLNLCEQPVSSLGTVCVGDTIVKEYILHNKTANPLKIQEIVPSCDCINAVSSSMVILSDSMAVVNVTFVAESEVGSFRRNVAIFYKEYENPEFLTLHGFIINNHNINLKE